MLHNDLPQLYTSVAAKGKEKNMKYKDNILNYSERLWNKKELWAIDEIIDEDVFLISPVRQTTGRTEFKSVMKSWLDAIPDMRVAWDDTICEGNKVVSRWTATGKHQAELLNIPATQRQLNYSGITIYTFNKDKVAEYWAIVDLMSIQQQLLDEG